jgi:hypothetical protein
VPGYEGLYQVSDLGRMFSFGQGTWGPRLLALTPVGKYGHLKVGLWKDDRRRDTLVHVLVLEAFAGPRPAGRRAGDRGGPVNAIDEITRRRVEAAREAVTAVQAGTYPAASESLDRLLLVMTGHAATLLGIIDRQAEDVDLLRDTLTDEPVTPEAGQLAAIRAILARFDWEDSDRQRALEDIERIAQGDDR